MTSKSVWYGILIIALSVALARERSGGGTGQRTGRGPIVGAIAAVQS